MRSTDRLSTPLLVAGIYAFGVGLLQLFPPLAEWVFSRPVVDPAMESLFGTTMVTLGMFLMVLSGEPNRSPTLVWVAVGGFLLAAADIVLYWSLGGYAAATAIVPTLINLAIALWLGVTLTRTDDESRVPELG